MGKHHPITGAKGSSESAKSPTETPDSLISIAYAKVLDGISEGPIVGLVNGNQSIFLDKTPLANADGSLNFSNVTVATRTGEADQDYVPGFPSVESETAVGVELKASQAWVQSISNLDLSAVRVRLQVPYLSNTDSKGNINGYEVQYAIDVATDSGAYVEVLTSSFNGKTTTTYERSHRLELPAAKTGWRVRVRRLTADSTSSSIQSRTSIASYTEIIDAKLRYPYSAVVGITVDASQFSSIPARAFDVKLRIVRVPSNYSPESRTYAGTWDGTFKLAWTDNPAWIYYDLLLNDRYGLGALITAAQVDRWGLYQIARYCDEMVDDGKGGKEPRFACNVYLQTRAEALQVLQDLASVFRGMAYWAAGSVTAVADMPSDPVYTYNQANVIDGAFTYAGSAKSTRFTVALVSWNDPANFYEKKVEYVSDQKGLARYGVQQTELTAFGCTSQGQAQRLGHYTLLTNRLENETVTFSVGLDGTIARPGQIIRVADEARAGRRIGGRISASTTTTVTLDSDATVAAGDTLVVILPTGVAETRKVKAYADRVVTVTQAFSTAPIAQSVFAIETTTLVPQTFRVLSVAEDFGQADLRYTITAVKHVAGKYAAIDSGAQIVTLPVTVIPSSVQAPPTNIQLSSYDSVDQGISISTLRATWEAPANAVSYDVWWRRDSNDWVYAGRCYTTSMEIRGVYAGTYLVRVAAINALSAASIWAYSQPTALAGKAGTPPALAQLKTTSGAWKITLDWAFPAEGAADSAYTEIQQATTAQGDTAQSMGLFAYPTNTYTLTGLAAGARLFFRGRLIDRIGNVGPWTNWVNGMASADSTDYNGLLTEDLLKSGLGKILFDKVDKIPVIESDLAQERSDRAAAIVAEQQARQSGLQQVAQVAADNLAAEAAARGQAIINEATIRQAADEQMSSRIQGVYAQVNPPMAGGSWAAGSPSTYAGVWSEQYARATGDAAEAASRETLSAQLRGGYTGTDPNQLTSGLIANERKIRLTAETALSQQISLVSAGVGEQFDSGVIWYFDSGVDGWTGNGSPTASGGWLRPASAATAAVYSPSGLAVNADTYRQVRFRIRRTGSPVWNGKLYWGDNWANSLAIDAPTFDTSGVATAIVNLSWAGSIGQIRLDLGSQTDTAYFELDWVAIGRASPGASYAALTAEQAARASADQALAQDMSTLTARVTDPKTGNAALSSSVDALTGRADNTEAGLSAVTTRVSGIYAQVNPPLAGANDWYAGSPTVLAGVYSEQFARAEADNALGKSVETVNAKTEKNAAAIVAEQNARSNADSALAESITKVQASTADNAALIQNEQKARTDADSAFANQMSLVQASVKDNAALIKNEQEARVSGDSALAKQVQDTQASLGNTNASVQQISQAQVATDNKVNATWAVKLGVTAEGTYYMAGIGASIEPNGGTAGLQSTVAVAADRFLVLGPGIDGKGKAFFSVVNGQTFMDSAFINKAYISNALIGQTVQSQQLTSYNQPIRTDNYYTGEMIIRNYGREGRYLQINDTGVFLIADGVVLVEMSLS